MSWRNILKEDIVKYENVNNMTTKKFGLRVISALESLGFEIQYDDRYEDMMWMENSDRNKYREFTTMSEKELDGYDGSYGYGKFGHELIITDMEEPYAYRQGFGADKMTIKYLPDDYDLYSNPRNEDYPVLAINSFKLDSIELATQGGKKKIDVKLGIESWDNSQGGIRELVKAILEAFKEYGQYEEDWGDMSEEEMREERGARAGRRFAAGARSLGYRDGYY
jgi:hypothetical protein